MMEHGVEIDDLVSVIPAACQILSIVGMDQVDPPDGIGEALVFILVACDAGAPHLIEEWAFPERSHALCPSKP